MFLNFFQLTTIIMEESGAEEYTYIVIGGGIAGVTCAEHVSEMIFEKSSNV